MQADHDAVRDIQPADELDLIRALPYAWDQLSMSNARRWDELRRQIGCRDYYSTREQALEGDIKCRRIMKTFILICLKARLTS